MSEERKIVNEIVLDADAETVWRAVSEAEELKKWFPLDARVKPGPGGAIWLSWGEGADWETPITIWEPNKHLRTADPPPSTMAVDYIIESRAGETVLRIVTSGFSGEDAFDQEVDMSAGWTTFLLGLRHYLRHHRGQPRAMAHFRHPVVEMTREEAFHRMLGAFGFSEVLQEGDRFAVTMQSGDLLEGQIEVFAPPINLTATLDNWNRAFLMIEIERGRGRCRPAAWLSLFGEAAAKAPSLQQQLTVMVTRAIAG